MNQDGPRELRQGSELGEELCHDCSEDEAGLTDGLGSPGEEQSETSEDEVGLCDGLGLSPCREGRVASYKSAKKLTRQGGIKRELEIGRAHV